jgi:hypothetical protein
MNPFHPYDGEFLAPYPYAPPYIMEVRKIIALERGKITCDLPIADFSITDIRCPAPQSEHLTGNSDRKYPREPACVYLQSPVGFSGYASDELRIQDALLEVLHSIRIILPHWKSHLFSSFS